jgi:hypothetical protein
MLVGCLSYLSAQIDSMSFPQAWVGDWAGELAIHNGQGEQQRIPMQLLIQPLADSTYTYTIIYGEDQPENRRNYLLKTVDAGRGHFQIDEQNGILLDEYYLGGKVYSRFSVMGGLLLSTLEKRGDELIYEIISGPLEPIAITGDSIVGEKEIPSVGSYGIRVQQRAVLRRQ